jgi:hypothetical protein
VKNRYNSKLIHYYTPPPPPNSILRSPIRRGWAGLPRR